MFVFNLYFVVEIFLWGKKSKKKIKIFDFGFVMYLFFVCGFFILVIVFG